MDEIKRLTPAQRARCNRLIRRLCANYDGGNCLPLDDGEGCVCVQTISYDKTICRIERPPNRWYTDAVGLEFCSANTKDRRK